MLLAGKITGAYGIKGWVKVHPYTDTPESFLAFRQWTLRQPQRSDPGRPLAKGADAKSAPRMAGNTPQNHETRAPDTQRVGGERAVDFAEGRRHGKGLIVRITGVDDRDAAEALRGAEIWVSDAALPELAKGEYYWHQLQGLKVRCEHEGSELLLGEVDHLLETGANDVLVLRPCEGSLDQRERLIPFIEGDVVTRIAPEDGEIRVDWHPED